MDDAGRRTAPVVGFKKHLRPEVVDGDAVYLFSERGVIALAGGRIEMIAPLLDGTRDLDGVLRDADGPGISREHVSELIVRLTDAGLVTARQPAAIADERAYAYWEARGLDPAAAIDHAHDPVRLVVVGGLDEASVLAALGPAGLVVTAAQAELSVVLCDDYLCPELDEIDAEHRSSGHPWLLARPVGERIWIGPIFQPLVHPPPAQAGPCWHCLAHRIRGQRPAEAHVQAALGQGRPVRRPAVAMPVLTAIALNLVAFEAMKWLAGQRYPGQGCVWTFDTADLGGRHHQVVRRPQCRACGDPALMRAQALRPLLLQSRPIRCRSGGGHRAQPPEHVIDRFGHLISPISGVVKQVRRDSHGPAFLNLFQSGPPPGSGAGVRGLRQDTRFQNGGKGITPLHAEASALCEALERYCGGYQGDEETVQGSLRGLGDLAIHPNECQLYHERQFAERERWNPQHSPHQHVGVPFDEEAVVAWTPVWSLTHRQHRLLPTGMLYFGAPHQPGSPPLIADSNGNAAGSSLEDAVLQGLFELIERDAVALWWYNRTKQPAVDIDAFWEPWLDELREGYARLGRELWVLDLTADLEVPVMAAVSRRVGGHKEHITLGFGAHTDPRVALRRAITEAGQLIAALPDDQPLRPGPGFDVDAAQWWLTTSTHNQPYLVPDADADARGPASYGFTRCTDLRDEVDQVHRRLRRVGLELLVLDQTRPDIELPVVKVVVPGLRHLWARFAPGRLYEVPVKLGRLAEPTEYENLNPFPLFL